MSVPWRWGEDNVDEGGAPRPTTPTTIGDAKKFGTSVVAVCRLLFPRDGTSMHFYSSFFCDCLYVSKYVTEDDNFIHVGKREQNNSDTFTVTYFVFHIKI